MPDIVFPLAGDIAQQSLRHDGSLSRSRVTVRGRVRPPGTRSRAEGDAALLQNARPCAWRILLIAGGTALLHTTRIRRKALTDTSRSRMMFLIWTIHRASFLSGGPAGLHSVTAIIRIKTTNSLPRGRQGLQRGGGLPLGKKAGCAPVSPPS